MTQKKKRGRPTTEETYPKVLKKIKTFEKKVTKISDQIITLERERITVNRYIRVLRIIKKPDGSHDIICICPNVYNSSKNPNAKLKKDRPQCKKCGERLEEKT